jgi:Peptidase S46
MPLLRNLLRAPSIVLLTLLAGCEPEAPPQAPPPPTAAPTAEPAPPPPAPKRTTFQDPGGMWMPEQIPAQAAQLKELGLEVDPAALADPASGVLGAVVSLGGCSASFVSDDGLIATNHHCSVPALQYNSTPAQNLLKDGFLAKTRAEEKWNGPSARVLVTVSLRDVTKDVTDGIDAIKDDAARQKKVEERTKAIVAACEKGRPDRRCNVAEYYGGGQYRLVEQLEIKDVRLVFAPHDRIGDYGGEVDNWHWPRHAGDVALYRAYVGPDGKSADHADANVPYHPPHRLKLPSKPLAEGDLVFVAGYPGATNRLRTAAEADEAVSFTYPHRIAWCDENIALLDKVMAQSPELKIKGMSLWRGLNNVRTKMKGIVEGLVKGGLAAQKAKREADLAAWIAADPSRSAAYGDVLGKIKALTDKHAKTREHDALMLEPLRPVSLLGSASGIVRMAEERAKPDADRDPAYQERNWERMAQREVTAQKGFDRRIDEVLLELAIQRALKLPSAGRPELVAAVVGKGKTTGEAIEKAIKALYDKTSLGDEKERVRLLKTATVADLKKSKDPLIQLALKLRPTYKAIEDEGKAFEGAMLILRPRYVEALSKLDPKPLAPDANGTLRVTYGTVRGYSPGPDAPTYVPFTTVSAMAAKATGADPFDAPSYLLDAVKAKKFGPYAQTPFGEPTVDFLSDLDITGGNSGSPTLNSRGEIVGLAFDGNYEAMASDWLFMPSITRTIHVDFRYVLWLLDAVYPGQHLIREMGGTPAFQ